jgi:hypothetical protein
MRRSAACTGDTNESCRCGVRRRPRVGPAASRSPTPSRSFQAAVFNAGTRGDPRITDVKPATIAKPTSNISPSFTAPNRASSDAVRVWLLTPESTPIRHDSAAEAPATPMLVPKTRIRLSRVRVLSATANGDRVRRRLSNQPDANSALSLLLYFTRGDFSAAIGIFSWAPSHGGGIEVVIHLLQRQYVLAVTVCVAKRPGEGQGRAKAAVGDREHRTVIAGTATPSSCGTNYRRGRPDQPAAPPRAPREHARRWRGE